MKEQKFCSGCQRIRNVEDMTKVLRGRVTRSICRHCLNRNTPSMYASKKNQRGVK